MPFKTHYQPDYPLLNLLYRHQDRLFERYSKLLMLRVDFAYLGSSSSFMQADEYQLSADMVYLLERCTTLSGLVGVAWVMEYGEEHRLHVHCAFYIDGQKHRKAWSFWEAISQYWKAVTQGGGYAYHCVPKPQYRVRGERVVSFSDRRGRKGMRYILSYLAKQEQRTERPVYFASRVPEAIQRGRPRSGRERL